MPTTKLHSAQSENCDVSVTEFNETYCFGYQRSEKDDEVKGSGNTCTTHYRLLDPRVGTLFYLDTLAAEFLWQSPYVSLDDNRIHFNDEYVDMPRPSNSPLFMRNFDGNQKNSINKVGVNSNKTASNNPMAAPGPTPYQVALLHTIMEVGESPLKRLEKILIKDSKSVAATHTTKTVHTPVIQ